MQAETWEKLNGTGWGEEVLSESANPSTTFGGPPPFAREALDVPEFMLSDYYTVSTVVPVAAYRAQGMGRVKRRQHLQEKHERQFVNGLFWFLVGVGAFVLLGNLGLKLADLMA